MKHEGHIEYTLTIDNKGEHGIVYKADLNSDIAGLMIAGQVLQHNMDALKEAKLTANGAMKREIGRQISVISTTLTSLTILTKSLCDNYEGYIKIGFIKEPDPSAEITDIKSLTDL